MIKAEELLKKRVEYFNDRDFESIYNIYSKESELKQFFCTKESYKEHFFKLINHILPESVEIYKVLYNNSSVEILYIEKARDLLKDSIINFYTKTYFILEDNTWKILKEERESSC